MPQLVARAALAVAAAVLIPSCYGTHLAPPRASGAAAYNFDFVGPDGTGHISVRAPRSLTLRELVLQTDRAAVMVQTMTRTMPGWNHWNATHMITIFAFDFTHHDPALDTVSYAETPSPLAGYRGPDFQTISVEALWVAMQAYNREAPWDPINVIS